MADRQSILVINGPNLNFLGIREPEVYGTANYKALEAYIQALQEEYGVGIDCVQTQSEGEIISFLQQAYSERRAGVVLNAGAYSHYSYAIYDALLSVSLPVVEVHLTNIYSRKEEFRKTDVLSAACLGVISGFGFDSYRLAVDVLIRRKNGV